jgi:hypothetical protein
VPVAYPNFSGQYSGVHHEPNMFGVYVSTPSVDTLDIHTVSNTRPPHIEGQFKTCFENNCDVGSVSGAVQRNGPSTLTLSFGAREGSLMSNRPATRNRLVVALEHGQTDAIVGQYTEAGSLMKVGPITIRFNHVGANPPNIQQEVYVYNWTAKLPKETFSGTKLNLGHHEVESCEHLLLTSETKATASCKTHVKLTSAAGAIFGDRPTDQVMQASFGKQPDGTWIGTSINYSAPPYSIEPPNKSPSIVIQAPNDKRIVAQRSAGNADSAKQFIGTWTDTAHQYLVEITQSNGKFRIRECKVARATEGQEYFAEYSGGKLVALGKEQFYKFAAPEFTPQANGQLLHNCGEDCGPNKLTKTNVAMPSVPYSAPVNDD